MTPRARVRTSAEDLAWIGVIVAAAFLVIAFIWITPVLAKLYPEPSRTFFRARAIASLARPGGAMDAAMQHSPKIR